MVIHQPFIFFKTKNLKYSGNLSDIPFVHYIYTTAMRFSHTSFFSRHSNFTSYCCSNLLC